MLSDQFALALDTAHRCGCGPAALPFDMIEESDEGVAVAVICNRCGDCIEPWRPALPREIAQLAV